MFHGAAHLLDNPHRFVPEDVALVHEGSEQLVEVKVGSADRRRGDPHDRIGRFLDRGFRNLFDPYILLAVPGYCPHESVSKRSPDRMAGALAVCLPLVPRWSNARLLRACWGRQKKRI
jgi:hypothetical protein